jgi:transcriptional regulator with XRE-family HTH domain
MSPHLLAERIKNWRKRAHLSAARAAEILGLPLRTLNGIEQGRGFRYPTLLLLAIDTLEG